MKHIVLHGILKEKYGPELIWEVDSPRDAIRGMMSNFPDFRQNLSSGQFQLIIGSLDEGLALSVYDLDFRFPDTMEFHIVPVPEGAKGGGKSKGVGMIIVGAIITIAAVVGAVFTGGATLAALAAAAPGILGSVGFTYGSIALTGLALVLAGISTMMTPKVSTPKYSQRESPEERASFLFQNGSVNTSEQGGCVPIILGRYRTGSIAISAGIQIEQIPVS